ncbi:hypothetical protein Vretifemale_3848 [Volvox reticuliferus]|nr:hypothetical protein Vretifemale_3848 [Volvox reticuliferus]
MDGRVAVLHGPTGATIATLQPHNKYVIRVTWAPGLSSTDESFSGSTEALPGGQVPALILVSASTDETIAISSLDLDDVIVDRGVLEGTRGLCCYSGGGMERGSCAEPGPPPACSDADSNCIGGMKGSSTGGGGAGGDVGAGCSGSGDGRGGEGGEGKRGHPAYELEHLRESEAEGLGRLKIIQQIPYGAAVTDVTFLHSGAGLGSGSGSGCGLGTGPTLVVSVRGSNYLRLLNVAQVVRQEVSATSNKGVPEELVNLNEAGDDHVSFTVKHLVVSPCRKYLLVCTDSPRLLILRTSDWSILRVIFGLPVDQFPQPVGAWHRDSNYIYAAGAGAQLCVFHLGSGRLVHTSVHHKVNVRDLDYDPARNLLATCSFDKTVKILAATDTAVPAVSDAAAASPLKENKAA